MIVTQAEKKKKIEQLTWDEWWERDDPNRQAKDGEEQPKVGFVAELKKRLREPAHKWRDGGATTTGCL